MQSSEDKRYFMLNPPITMYLLISTKVGTYLCKFNFSLHPIQTTFLELKSWIPLLLSPS